MNAVPTLIASCPGCQRRVRLPLERLADHPHCPSCKALLFPGVPIVLDDRSFDPFVTGHELPVLVDFWAPWCGPCRQFAPVLEQFAKTHANRVLAVKVDTDQATSLAQRYQIRSIPTLALFRHGEPIARRAGALPAHALEQWVSQSVGIV